MAEEYGAREKLLRRANLLLDATALRQLVAQFEGQMQEALATTAGDTRMPVAVFRISGLSKRA